MKIIPLLVAALLPLGSAWGNVTEVRIRTAPEKPFVRPLESIVVQALVYGEVTARDGSKRTGRLRRGGATARVATTEGGWLSKPFRFQGRDELPFVEQSESTAGRIFGSLAGEYVLQDSFLYTAPEKPGQYEVEVSLEGKTARVTIEVSAEAPSLKPAETVDFPPERISLDPYRSLAEHWAPFLAQETWFQPKADYPARFDFDKDWDGDNNWQSLDTGSSQAYVYYAVMETATHWFLIYNVFHARDYSDKCVIGTCHENDNEGVILTVRKDGTEFGRLQAMETLAHNNVYSFVADTRVTRGLHDVDGTVDLHEGRRPIVFIESGGHGIYGSRSSHARYDISRDTFTAGTGVTFIYKGVAERPRHANDRLVGYDLLPIHEHWWSRAYSGSGWTSRTFDDYFTYSPLGGRPGVPHRQIAGAFLGRKEAENKAKPFWGWHDSLSLKRRVLAVGQWALDPAYAVSLNLRFPRSEPFSLDYVFNPYLGAAGPLPAVAATSSEPTAPQAAAQGHFEFRVWIDGSVEVFVQGDRVRYQVLGGGPIRSPESGYSEPLPGASLRSLEVRVKEGRGTVRLLEEPSAANGYTARLRIDDPRSGPGRYHVSLEWVR